MEVGKTYKLNITGYDMNGLGLSNVDGVVVFVEKALQDEVVLAEITYTHKKYAFAKTIKVFEPCKRRMMSPCPYYEGCGGWDLLHLDFSTEAQIKTNKVVVAFHKINKLTDIKINPIIRNQHVLGY